MSAMSDFMESGLINAMFRANTDSFAFPVAIYIGLTTDTPSDATPAANELSGDGYARIQVTQADGSWKAATVGGATENVAAITFADATANWLTASGVIITDATGEGNVWLHGALATPRLVLNGDALRFKSGDLDITFA
jgi:hypothetical protein